MVDLESGDPAVYTGRLFHVFHELGITVTLTCSDDHVRRYLHPHDTFVA